MSFLAPVPMSLDAARARFIQDCGQQLVTIDAYPSAPESFKQSADQLQRVLGEIHAAVDDSDYFEFRRHLVRLVAECYRTARDRNILTEQAAVAATDAAKL